MQPIAKKKIGTQVDPVLHQRLKVLSALTGKRMDSLIEAAIRKLTAEIPEGNFVTFEEMHAQYERSHGMKVGVPGEARKLQAKVRSRRRKQS